MIDTNIAYYLSYPEKSKDKNFNIEAFKKDESSKLISTISLIELYLHNNPNDFKFILNKLEENKIGIAIYGDNINYKNKPSIRKLLEKPKSYLIRIIKYFEEIYLNYVSKNVMYFGFLVGGLYCYLLELQKPNIKLKKSSLEYISFKKHESDVIEAIKTDIRKYFKTRKTEDCNAIFYHPKMLIAIAIASYKCKEYNETIKFEKEKIKFNEIKNKKIDCFGLMQKTCKKRGFKTKDIIDKFHNDLGDDLIDLSGLKLIVEDVFTQNNQIRWNDFADFILIKLADDIDKQEGSCAYITSEKKWQNFIKKYSKTNHCAELSWKAINKFYRNT